MGKQKKGLGIKTTRYFTKSCSKCSFEYPNWFTNCPKCGAAWDEMEAKAIRLSGLEKIPVNSLKSTFGHTLGAAGLVETIISIMAMQRGDLVPTYGFRHPSVEP